MTAIQLIAQWHTNGQIDTQLYHLLKRNIERTPFTKFALNTHNISAERLIELIESGKIIGVYSIGPARVQQLRNAIKPHHDALYRDRLQLSAWGEVAAAQLGGE